MATIAALRKEAKGLGITPAKIRGASSAAELKEIIDAFSGNGSKPKAAKKKKSGRATTERKRTTAKRSTSKRNSKTGRGKTTPAAQSRKRGKAKRSSAAPDSGRNMLDSLDFSQTDGWNPREGSPPDLIVKSLRKFRGNRAKVFAALNKNIADFVGARKNDGSKRSKADREKMLMYRISRTAWEFAVRTGQHEASENRVEYGTGGTGEGVWKPASKRKAAAKRSTAKRSQGSKKSAGKRSTAKRGAQSRKKVSAKRTTAKRGGSKRKAARK